MAEEELPLESPKTDPTEERTDKDRWPMPKILPPYPKVIKISERRIPGPSKTLASCEQVEVIDGGQDSRPVLDDEGNPVRVIIPEKAAWTPAFPNDKRWFVDDSRISSRDTPKENNECGCVWMFE